MRAAPIRASRAACVAQLVIRASRRAPAWRMASRRAPVDARMRNPNAEPVPALTATAASPQHDGRAKPAGARRPAPLRAPVGLLLLACCSGLRLRFALTYSAPRPRRSVLQHGGVIVRWSEDGIEKDKGGILLADEHADQACFALSCACVTSSALMLR